jgi:hypothetical protein
VLFAYVFQLQLSDEYYIAFKSACLGFVCTYCILSRVLVTTDGVWVGSRIYWTLTQLMTTVYKPLSHRDLRSQTRCLVTSSNSVRSSASWITAS